jgi:hypothetical protein
MFLLAGEILPQAEIASTLLDKEFYFLIHPLFGFCHSPGRQRRVRVLKNKKTVLYFASCRRVRPFIVVFCLFFLLTCNCLV